MDRGLVGVEAKLERAQRHSQELCTVVDRFLETDPYEIVQEVNFDPSGERGEVVMWRRLVNELPGAEIGAVLGDCLFDLRSALDNLIWALIQANGKEPHESVTFPVARDPDHFESQRGNIAQLPDEAIQVVESLQPYHGRDGPNLRVGGGLHPILLVHELHRRDKHRLITPMLVAMEGSALPSGKVGAGVPTRPTLRDVMAAGSGWFDDPWTPPYHGQVVAKLPFVVTGPNPEIQLYPDARYGVAILGVGPRPGYPIGPLISQVCDRFAGPILESPIPLFP